MRMVSTRLPVSLTSPQEDCQGDSLSTHACLWLVLSACRAAETLISTPSVTGIVQLANTVSGPQVFDLGAKGKDSVKRVSEMHDLLNATAYAIGKLYSVT